MASSSAMYESSSSSAMYASSVTRRPPPSMPPRSRPVPHRRMPFGEARWEALGTGVVLRLTDPRALNHARTAVESELDAIDRACSRFRCDSEIARVNASVGTAVPVSPLLAEALELALRAAALTDGDVDPTVGSALVLSGYDRDWHLLDAPDGVPTADDSAVATRSDSLRSDGLADRPDELPRSGSAARNDERAPVPAITARRVCGWRNVVLDQASRTVRVPPGFAIDLGATAKAWVADRAAQAAALAGDCGALVSVGGDMAVSGPAPACGWAVHVTDDHRSAPTAPGQTVTIRSGGLATSSTAVRRWRHGGQLMHHIIDPATGAPVRATWRTVSVAAASCADANIATTAALVRAGAAPAWLEGLGVPARLVNAGGRVYTIGDWPAERFPGLGAAPSAPAVIGNCPAERSPALCVEAMPHSDVVEPTFSAPSQAERSAAASQAERSAAVCLAAMPHSDAPVEPTFSDATQRWRATISAASEMRTRP